MRFSWLFSCTLSVDVTGLCEEGTSSSGVAFVDTRLGVSVFAFLLFKVCEGVTCEIVGGRILKCVDFISVGSWDDSVLTFKLAGDRPIGRCSRDSIVVPSNGV